MSKNEVWRFEAKSTIMEHRLLLHEMTTQNGTSQKHIAPDKTHFFSWKVLKFFLSSLGKHLLWYSLEVPHWGTSNEYLQHMFSWRNWKNIYLIPLITRTIKQNKKQQQKKKKKKKQQKKTKKKKKTTTQNNRDWTNEEELEEKYCLRTISSTTQLGANITV